MDSGNKHSVLVEASVFAQKGGWVLDTQFTESVGGPYLLAHGLGVPVLDASTEVDLPAIGAWRLWVRTRNWVPDAPDAPGRFKVLIDGQPLPPIFGLAPAEWGWADGGVIEVTRTRLHIALSDLTGFDGRCDALVFMRDLAGASPPAGGSALNQWRETLRGETGAAVDQGTYDLVVIGGGIAGTCAALAAARQGLSVALIHDRSVLGGNASQEIRVWCGGEARHPLVREVRNRFMNREPGAAYSDRHRMRLVQDERTLMLFTGWRACGVVRSGDGKSITAVDARQMESQVVGRFQAPLFIDATGDGWVGYWAGADYRMGRESTVEYGESMAPQQADAQTLGCSLMWNSMEANTDTPFPAVPWAESVAQGIVAVQGEWNWEYGLDLDTIRDAEAIRDHLLRVIYGSFSLAKREGVNARRVLDFVPYNLGKRESRRLLGDVVLTENDVREKTPFPDAVATGTWSIDLHEREGSADFLTVCNQPLFGRYFIPFRTLYSRNVGNLMMAGRCFSATHVGLGSPRVMNTTGQMGVAVGCAASVCKKYAISPRELAHNGERMHELQRVIGGAFPGHPDPLCAGWQVIDEMDTDHVRVSGAWKPGLHENGDHYGSGFLAAEKGDRETWVAFSLLIRETGIYRLRLIWNTYWNGRANAVPVVISHAQGTTRVVVDMTQGSGLWHELGDYSLKAGVSAEVRIETDGTEGIVVADAVACEKVK